MLAVLAGAVCLRSVTAFLCGLFAYMDRAMARNVEIKARVSDVDAILKKIASIAGQDPIELVQIDTFFACPHGRLKLRTSSPSEGELIFYKRADTAEPKESVYLVTPTSTPDSLRAVLCQAYGQVGHVKKRRQLYMVGDRSRVQVDQVDGLGGYFLEIEVVLADDESVQTGADIANELLALLEISPNQQVRRAYVDLLGDVVEE